MEIPQKPSSTHAAQTSTTHTAPGRNQYHTLATSRAQLVQHIPTRTSSKTPHRLQPRRAISTTPRPEPPLQQYQPPANVSNHRSGAHPEKAPEPRYSNGGDPWGRGAASDPSTPRSRDKPDEEPAQRALAISRALRSATRTVRHRDLWPLGFSFNGAPITMPDVAVPRVQLAVSFSENAVVAPPATYDTSGTPGRTTGGRRQRSQKRY
jgi:hypothetical protein